MLIAKKIAVKSLQKGKSGSDGIPPELYLALWDTVGALILESINYALEHKTFHRDQKTALITLLLKDGKDPMECSSYRPISLICGERDRRAPCLQKFDLLPLIKIPFIKVFSH